MLTYFYFPNEFLSFSFLKDPDKKWQIHFCFVDHDATLGRAGRVVETADAAALPRYSCTTLVHGEGLSWPGGGDSFEPLRGFHVSEGGRRR